jgi:hypothetical protein
MKLREGQDWPKELQGFKLRHPKRVVATEEDLHEMAEEMKQLYPNNEHMHQTIRDTISALIEEGYLQGRARGEGSNGEAELRPVLKTEISWTDSLKQLINLKLT